MPKMPNLRTMKVDSGSGKDVRDTSQLKGEAKKTSAEGAKNETTQYTTGSTSMGSLGGRNTNS